MKRYVLLVAIIITGIKHASAQTESSALYKPIGPILKVVGEEHCNMGDVPQGREVKHSYTIVNDGDEALVIKEVVNTRSGAVAEWTKLPILPGNKGIVVEYVDTKDGNGAFTESLYIRSNAGNNNCGLGYRLTLSGYVNTVATPVSFTE